MYTPSLGEGGFGGNTVVKTLDTRGGARQRTNLGGHEFSCCIDMVSERKMIMKIQVKGIDTVNI